MGRAREHDLDVDGHVVAERWHDRGAGSVETGAALAAAAFAASRVFGELVSDQPLADLRLATSRDVLTVKHLGGGLLLMVAYGIAETTPERVAESYAIAVETAAPILARRRPRGEGDDAAGVRAPLRPGDPPRRPPPEGRAATGE